MSIWTLVDKIEESAENEVAAILINNPDKHSKTRMLAVQLVDTGPHTMRQIPVTVTSCNADPLSYVLFSPPSDRGWVMESSPWDPSFPPEPTQPTRFGMPIDLDVDSVSYIAMQSKEADTLRATSIVIWDEATASHKYAVNLLDTLLKDLMSSDLPFGGKTVVLGANDNRWRFSWMLANHYHRYQCSAGSCMDKDGSSLAAFL